MGVIDEIKQRVDIVEVVSDYLPLQKAGRNFKALCPFHTEKVPSFYVFPERQSWHCFGACGSGGDVFSFVMKKEGVDFGEALKKLAQRAGVSLAQPKEVDKGVERLVEINEAATEYYHHLLLRSPVAEMARIYLDGRGVFPKTIQDFQLGFSLDSWEALRGHLMGKGYQEEELIAAGLLVEKEQGGSYDRFRNRLMFPIRDIRGRVLGFGARALDDSLPKYINSPQTKIFDKSGILYGIDRAKDSIRRQNRAIIVEGYMDVIIAHQYGFDNVVASMGTALTEKQVSILKPLTQNLSLALDADAAGEVATLRGIEVATHALDYKVMPVPTSRGLIRYENVLNAEISIITLTQGKDPDEIIKENPEDWRHLVEKASPVIEYTVELVISKLDLTKLRDKSFALDQLLPVIDEVKDPIRQAHYVQKLARLIGVDEQAITSALGRMRRAGLKRGEKQPPSSSIPSLSSGDPVEEYCLSLLLHYPELRNRAGELSADYFERSENRELFLAWLNSPALDSMREKLDIILQRHLEELLAKDFPPLREGEPERALADCLYRLRERRLMGLKAKEELLMAEAESAADAAQLEELKQSALKLNVQLKEIFRRKRHEG